MWPLERRADVVRVGRYRIEYWASSAHGLILRDEQALDCVNGMQEAELAAALTRLLQSARGSTRASDARTAKIDMIFESAWLPMMLVETGGTLWSSKTLEALLRHRFAQHYNDRDDPVAAWELQLDYRPGDACGLGFGLAPNLRKTAIDAAATAGLRLESLQPAFAWGWARLRQHRRDGRADRRRDWWLWVEQERSLICHIDERGRLASLNAGAAVPEGASDCLRLMEIEAVRQGVPAGEVRGVVVDWRQASHAARRGAGDRLELLSVAGGEATTRAGFATPMRAGVTA